jgi:hypothetical protein
MRLQYSDFSLKPRFQYEQQSQMLFMPSPGVPPVACRLLFALDLWKCDDIVVLQNRLSSIFGTLCVLAVVACWIDVLLHLVDYS